MRLQNGLGDMTLAVYVRLQWGVCEITEWFR